MQELSPRVLDIDCEAQALRIEDFLRSSLARMHRRGVVLGLSGGVDSSVCAALAARALGPQRVVALLMPERESGEASTRLGEQVARELGLRCLHEDITPALDGLQCYARRDQAIRELFPDYGPGWKSKLAIAEGAAGRVHFFDLVVQDPRGELRRRRLPLQAYLRIVAATNFKQRVRKNLEYHHADALNYAVLGTPNRLEFDQGFFVKNGDGAADLKPIAHLYKTQVYALARHLGLPREVCEAQPTTDTYSLAQGQDEFYFALEWPRMDLALWARDHGVAAERLAEALDIEPAQAHHVYADIDAKRRGTAYLHWPALRIEADEHGPTP